MAALVLDFTVDSGSTAEPVVSGPATRLRFRDLRREGPVRAWLRLRSRRFERCVAVVYDLRAQGRWLTILLLTLLVRADERRVVDLAGAERELTLTSFLLREIPWVLRRGRIEASVRRTTRRELRRIPRGSSERPVVPRRLAYVRSDLGGPLTAGGSLAHLRGVVEGLSRTGCEVSVVTPAPIAGLVLDDRRVHVVPPDERFELSVELPHLAYNLVSLPRLEAVLRECRADLVYCRHALGAWAPAAAAHRAGVPLVVEFNGSEVWVARHWGNARRGLDLFSAIEKRVLRAADLVVAVSEPLRPVLHEAGVPDHRVLVNPNGVDPDRFAPAKLARGREDLRHRLGVGPGEILVGFVGTFGPWHGGEVLAEAALRVPSPWSERLTYLFLGDGERREPCERILREGGRMDRARFTGLVPHEETPAWLAACDVCVSPQVPNPDGTPFFGSPTKLFEYLACGKPVVASRLGQIAEIAEHGRNAWLVPPGDAQALAEALVRLADDPALRARLGEAAREDVIRKHSWTAHVGRILERLAHPRRPMGRA